MPRATTAACDVRPPRLVRIPRAATMPGRSSGAVSLRTSTTSSPRAAHSVAVRGVEDGLADGGAGGGVHPRGEPVAGRVGVEAGEHQPGELGPGDPLQRLVEVDQALGDHVGGHPERCFGRALADPGLQHPELAAVDRELDVAHVEVVPLQAWT